MQKHVLMLTTSAFILACGGVSVSAQQHIPGGPMMQQQQQPTDHEGHGVMGHGGMMGRGMRGPRTPVVMRIIFSLVDSDGDGTISLPEFQAGHERIFRAMDRNKDGRLTQEEIQAFIQGTTRSSSR